MAYIMFVNPAILERAGMDHGAVFVATCLAAALGSLIMGLYANYPIALAPAMGLNAYFAFTMVPKLGGNWQLAIGCVFVSGLLFFALSLSPLRAWLIDAIPMSLKLGIAAGIALSPLRIAPPFRRRWSRWATSASRAWLAVVSSSSPGSRCSRCRGEHPRRALAGFGGSNPGTVAAPPSLAPVFLIRCRGRVFSLVQSRGADAPPRFGDRHADGRTRHQILVNTAPPRLADSASAAPQVALSAPRPTPPISRGGGGGGGVFFFVACLIAVKSCLHFRRLPTSLGAFVCGRSDRICAGRSLSC